MLARSAGAVARFQQQRYTAPLLRAQQHGPLVRTSARHPTFSAAATRAKPKEDTVDIAATAKSLGVRLTRAEADLLKRRIDSNGDGFVTVSELQSAGRKALEERWMKELFLSAVEQPQTALDRAGTHLVLALDYVGTALFAVVGTQVAGDAGMNVVGCTLVGCIAAMGGGTLNCMLYGSSALLSSRAGMKWVRQPSFLWVAILSSVVTFYTWPEYCKWQAENELKYVIGTDHLEKDGSVGEPAFVAACDRDKDFLAGIRAGLGTTLATSPSELFHLVDTDGSGYVDIDEMQHIVGKKFNSTPTVYFLDTCALSALSVVGVHSALGWGLHPLIAATSGITICFGGIMRDVLSGRDLAIGGQSYAFATGAGSLVYVLLRELRLRRVVAVPLIAKIVMSFGTTSAIRTWEFARGEPLLTPMHGDSKQRK